MDPLGEGQPNTEDPSGSAALVVSTSNVTGASITMVNPTQSAPTQVVQLKAISPINLGAVISYGSGSVENSNGVEVFTSYVVQWSATTTGFSSSNSITLGAVGGHGNVWFLNSQTSGISGSFTNGQAYYFRVEGVNPVGPGPWTYYGGPNVVCTTTTCATTVTIGTPSGTGYNTVTGTVTIPSSITPTGPLFVGFFNQDTNTAYATVITSPSNSTPNSYTVEVPNGTDYFNFAILDQNKDGLIGVGNISNTDNNNDESIIVSGPMSNQDVTLPTAASTATVSTSYNQNVNPSGSNTSYGINFDVRSGNGSKLPVKVTLMSGPNVLQPVDLSNACQSCGTPQWQYNPYLDTDVPNVGDSYSFDITYSNATSETITAAGNRCPRSGRRGIRAVAQSQHHQRNHDAHVHLDLPGEPRQLHLPVLHAAERRPHDLADSWQQLQLERFHVHANPDAGRACLWNRSDGQHQHAAVHHRSPAESIQLVDSGAGHQRQQRVRHHLLHPAITRFPTANQTEGRQQGGLLLFENCKSAYFPTAITSKLPGAMLGRGCGVSAVGTGGFRKSAVTR